MGHVRIDQATLTWCTHTAHTRKAGAGSYAPGGSQPPIVDAPLLFLEIVVDSNTIAHLSIGSCT